jgi:uncharacterized protein (TIGR02145 family)
LIKKIFNFEKNKVIFTFLLENLFMKIITRNVFIVLLLSLNLVCSKEITREVSTNVTAELTEITATSFKSKGVITSDIGTQINERGICLGLNHNPAISDYKTSDGSGTGTFSSSIDGLNPGKTYFLRAYFTNDAGTTYGNELEIALPASLSSVTTSLVNSITFTSAICGGKITDDGGGSITARGICWSNKVNPTIADNLTKVGTGTSDFTSSISGLSPGMTYFIRAYSTNSAGTSYGGQVIFSTKAGAESGLVKDIEGNTYSTIRIGAQVWMAENLRTTKYNDGTLITNVKDDATWKTLQSEAFCWYNNDDVTNKANYGALYNWYSINTQKLCPAGWHVPTDAEWTNLTNYLGGKNVAGGKMKDIGTNRWIRSDSSFTNSSGFTGLPGGYRRPLGNYFGISNYGYFWSSSEYYGTFSWSQYLQYDNGTTNRDYGDKRYGLSVRCIKDN